MPPVPMTATLLKALTCARLTTALNPVMTPQSKYIISNFTHIGNNSFLAIK
jgi:hypothetical protein